MSLEYADVFEVLANGVPGFPPTKEDLEEPLPYIFMQQMVDFVCAQAQSGFTVPLERFALLLEKLVLEGDDNVHDLAVDALESLMECDEKEMIARHLGPKTRQLWLSITEQGPSQ